MLCKRTWGNVLLGPCVCENNVVCFDWLRVCMSIAVVNWTYHVVFWLTSRVHVYCSSELNVSCCWVSLYLCVVRARICICCFSPPKRHNSTFLFRIKNALSTFIIDTDKIFAQQTCFASDLYKSWRRVLWVTARRSYNPVSMLVVQCIGLYLSLSVLRNTFHRIVWIYYSNKWLICC